MERETGIEPAPLAWKAKVLPLNYSREPQASEDHFNATHGFGGGDWIRTSVGVSQQIYSLPPLATRAPLRAIVHCSTGFRVSQIRKHLHPKKLNPLALCRRQGGLVCNGA